MKVKITSIFLTACMMLFALACSTTNNQPSQKAMYKDAYIDQFKLTYFRYLLLKSYNNSKAVEEIIEMDNSGFHEPILMQTDYKLIDSLTTADNEKLKADSVEGENMPEGTQGKRPLGYILDKVQSKWLDRLARKRYIDSGFKASVRDLY